MGGEKKNPIRVHLQGPSRPTVQREVIPRQGEAGETEAGPGESSGGRPKERNDQREVLQSWGGKSPMRPKRNGQSVVSLHRPVGWGMLGVEVHPVEEPPCVLRKGPPRDPAASPLRARSQERGGGAYREVPLRRQPFGEVVEGVGFGADRIAIAVDLVEEVRRLVQAVIADVDVRLLRPFGSSCKGGWRGERKEVLKVIFSAPGPPEDPLQPFL